MGNGLAVLEGAPPYLIARIQRDYNDLKAQNMDEAQIETCLKSVYGFYLNVYTEGAKIKEGKRRKV